MLTKKSQTKNESKKEQMKNTQTKYKKQSTSFKLQEQHTQNNVQYIEMKDNHIVKINYFIFNKIKDRKVNKYETEKTLSIEPPSDDDKSYSPKPKVKNQYQPFPCVSQ